MTHHFGVKKKVLHKNISPNRHPLLYFIYGFTCFIPIFIVHAQDATPLQNSQHTVMSTKNATPLEVEKEVKAGAAELSEQAKPTGRYLSIQLKVPGPSWTKLTEAQVKNLSNIAVAGAIDAQRALGLVLVEPIKHLNLTDYATAVLEQNSLSELLVESVNEVNFQGFSALRIVYSGDEANGRFRYLCYVFIHEHKAYQIVAGGPVAVTTADSLEVFSKAISLNLSNQKQKTSLTQPQNKHGVGWQDKNGTFLHSLSGVKATKLPAWAMLTGEQLKRVNKQAFFGFVHSESQLHMLLFDRPCPHPDENQCLTWTKDELWQDLGLKENIGTYDFKYLGEQRSFQSLEHENGRYSYLHHVLIKEGRALHTLVWTLNPTNTVNTQDQDLLWRLLPEGLSAFSWLTTLEKQSVLLNLQNLEEQGQIAHSKATWLWGKYHHFDTGLTWERPPGLWEVKPEKIPLLNKNDALLSIAALRYGLKTQIRIVMGHSQRKNKVHQTLWQELNEQLKNHRGTCQDKTTGKRLLAHAEALWSKCTFRRLSALKSPKKTWIEWTYQLDTIEAFGGLIHLLSWAPKHLFEGEGKVVREGLEDGLKLGQPAGVIFNVGSDLSPNNQKRELWDERFRYKLKNLPLHGRLKVRSSLPLGQTSSLVEYGNEHISMMSFVVGEMEPKKLATLIDQLAKTNFLYQNKARSIESSTKRKSLPIKAKPQEAKRSDNTSTLKRRKIQRQGYEGEILFWQEDNSLVHRSALLLTAPPLVYGIVIVGDSNGAKYLLKKNNFELLID